MPNPYHNHLGEFCAKEDMQASIRMLTETGQIDKALQLTAELKTIEEAASKKAFFKDPAVNNAILQERVDNLVRVSTYLSSETSKSVLSCERELNEVEDKDLPKIIAILEAEREVWQETALTPIIEAEEKIKEEFQKITGFKDGYKLNSERKYARLQAESASHKVFNAIKEEAVANGIPENYARYFVASSKTKMGYADDYLVNGGGRVKRPDDMTPLDFKNFPTSMRNKEFKEKYLKALENVSKNPDMQEAMKEVNAHALKLNDLNSKAAEVSKTTDNALDRTRNIVNVRNKVQTYDSLISGVKGLIDWRKNLRNSGVKTKRITPFNVAGLTGANVSRDSDGKVNNMWAVNNRNGTLKPDRIIAVQQSAGSRGNSYVLVGESGEKYHDFTHYHSRRADRTTAQIIIDDTVKVTNPLTDDVRFVDSIDSGD